MKEEIQLNHEHKFGFYLSDNKHSLHTKEQLVNIVEGICSESHMEHTRTLEKKKGETLHATAGDKHNAVTADFYMVNLTPFSHVSFDGYHDSYLSYIPINRANLEAPELRSYCL